MTIAASNAVLNRQETGKDWYAEMGSMQFVRLKAEARALELINLPAYLGSTLRGAFGMALLRSCCVQRRQNCDACRLKHICVYSYIFETPIEDDKNERRYRKAPHPFVFMLDMHSSPQVLPAEVFEIRLTVFGNAIKYLPYIVLAFGRMGKQGIGRGRGRFRLEKVETIDTGDRVLETIYSGEDFSPVSAVLDLSVAKGCTENLPVDRISIEFLTPVRLVRKGRLCRRIDFVTLIRNLALRLINLQRFHGFAQADMPVAEMVADAEEVATVEDHTRWLDWQRYSKRQGRRMTLGGLVGEVAFQGYLEPFLPLLVMGSWINLGKGTSFGLGRFRLITR